MAHDRVSPGTESDSTGYSPSGVHIEWAVERRPGVVYSSLDPRVRATTAWMSTRDAEVLSRMGGRGCSLCPGAMMITNK